MRSSVLWVVLHVAECPRERLKALAVRNYFKTAGVSAHYIVDPGEVVAYIPEGEIAWHAAGANANSIGVELCGYSHDPWDDAASKAELALATTLVRDICNRWSIPIVWLGPKDLVARKKGITGHKEVTDAFRGGYGHWDPGPLFDRLSFIKQVEQRTPEPLV